MNPLLLTSMAAVSTSVGGYCAVLLQRRVHLLMSFGTGVLVGAALLDLFPSALSAAENSGSSKALVFPIASFVDEGSACPKTGASVATPVEAADLLAQRVGGSRLRRSDPLLRSGTGRRRAILCIGGASRGCGWTLVAGPMLLSRTGRSVPPPSFLAPSSL